MHAYRSAANECAWFFAPYDPVATFNPVAKYRASKKPERVESFRQDTNASQVSAGRRPNIERSRSDPQMPQIVYASPQTRGTMSTPTVPHISSTSESNAAPFAIDSAIYRDSYEQAEASGDSSCEIDVEFDDEHEGPRRRKRIKNPFRRMPTHNDAVSIEKTKKIRYPASEQLKVIFLVWINMLLPAAPIGIALYYNYRANPSYGQSVAIFAVNLVALVPLTDLVMHSVWHLNRRIGATLGCLFLRVFGNAAGVMVPMFAIFGGQMTIARSFLIGSILSSVLFGIGSSIFFGGLNRVGQHFDATVAPTASIAVLYSAMLLLFPAVFSLHSGLNEAKMELSRAVAVILLSVYGCYLFFQLKTHASAYDLGRYRLGSKGFKRNDTIRSFADIGAGIASSTGVTVSHEAPMRRPRNGKLPQLDGYVAIFTMCASGVLLGICCMCAVKSTEGIAQRHHISPTFIGLVLFPMAVHVAEFATAIVCAMKDKVDLSIVVAMDISSETILLVSPPIIIVGWIAGLGQTAATAVTLDFDIAQVAILFASVIAMNQIVQDGKSDWLRGVFILASYLMICVTSWFYMPG